MSSPDPKDIISNEVGDDIKGKNDDDSSKSDEDLISLCMFKDEDFEQFSLESRVDLLKETRNRFYAKYGNNAATLAGFHLGTTVEKRLLAFLISRCFDVDLTLQMIADHIQWLQTYKIYEIDLYKRCPTAFISGCMRIAGSDKEGVPIVHVQSHLWKPSEYYSVDEYIYYISWMNENARRMCVNQTGMEKTNFIMDMENFSLLKADFTCIKTLVTVLQEHFPEILKRLFVVNSNFAFRSVMKMIQCMISKRTSRRIIILGHGVEMHNGLLKYISSDNLYQKYGGSRQTPYPVWPDSYIQLKS